MAVGLCVPYCTVLFVFMVSLHCFALLRVGLTTFFGISSFGQVGIFPKWYVQYPKWCRTQPLL